MIKVLRTKEIEQKIKKNPLKGQQFIDNEYQILPNWKVMRKTGEIINIQADAGFFSNIFNQTPHKVTFAYLENK